MACNLIAIFWRLQSFSKYLLHSYKEDDILQADTKYLVKDQGKKMSIINHQWKVNSNMNCTLSFKNF